MKQQILKIALTIALAIPAVSNAQFVMTNSDALGNSSFNSAGQWTSGATPTAGSTYSTGGWLLRSPASGSAFAFAGDSLTVGGGSGAAAGGSSFLGSTSVVTANNNALIFKVASMTLTVNNLILDGGQIRDGNGDGNYTILNGSINVTGNGGAFMAQDTNIINSVISGSGQLYIGDNGSGTAPRVIVFTSGASTFNGNITMTNTHVSANYSRLTFASGSVMNFKIGANHANNTINGQGTVTFNGSFTFDLSTADNTIGDSWDIVDPAVLSTYSGFTVNGFTQNGTSWDDIAKGVDYDFSQTTGLLTVQAVPEPSTLALCGMGLAGLLALKRRNK